MAQVAIEGLTKRFGDHLAVDRVDLHIAEGEFVTLLGPSGCGKTTTLRCLAGLEDPTAGRISIGGRLVCAPDRGVWAPPDQRAIGMVFQSYALWPHLDVRGNIAYALRRAGVARDERDRRVLDMLTTIGLAERADHPIGNLSGGQQQRVALA
ncbi:MAG: ABC transporter ATP-binding protein, partial [Sporichthyaceae bacterium]|nr:ABC transporter ATP-binding protein [Sporichthyaceae bacterium]